MSSVTDLTTLGLGPTGFVAPRQADVTAALQAQWRSAFGAQVNLDPRSNNGQLINIMAERFALLYELVEAVYNASYPAGAEGVAVDNLLALQGLTRLPASPTKTAPSPVTQGNGVTLYGLVCYGTAGTLVPAGSLVADTAAPPHVLAIDADITIGAAQNAVQTLIFNPPPTAGTYTLTLTAPSGTAYTTAPIAYNAAPRQVQLTFPTMSGPGGFSLTLAGLGTVQFGSAQPVDATGSGVAATIAQQFSLTGVTGTGNAGTGIFLDFGPNPTPVITAGGTYPPTVTPSIASAINGLGYNSAATSQVLPFTDVGVTQASNVLTLSFGANTPAKGQPSTAAQPVALAVVNSTGTSTLVAGQTNVNVSVLGTVQGQPAQGVGSATAKDTGPVTVLAGAISVMQTAVAGWTGVTNQLDCLPGSDVESDAAALVRRSGLVAGQASGPLAAILQRVQEVAGVTAALAVANSSMASQQIVTVDPAATGGAFALSVGGQTTQLILYNASAGLVQRLLRALPGYSTATVTGTATSGFLVDWGASVGGQAVPLMQVTQNSTSAPVTVVYGRFPKSVEVVVQGGSNSDVAQAIFSAAPAGLATYGQPVLTTTANTTLGQPTLTVTNTAGLTVGLGVECTNVPAGAQVTSIAGNVITLSTNAIATASAVTATFGYTVGVQDGSGNLQLVRFSRPVAVPIYVRVLLTTDTFNTPGQSASGVNAASLWSQGYVPAIQQAIKDAIAAVGIGGTLSATGTGGIANSFRNVAQGVEDAVVQFDTVQNPTNTARINLAAEQVPQIDLSNVTVTTQ